MKFIKKFKSLNYNDRKRSKLDKIIIHYTNLQTNKEAIEYLCSREKKVSSHFLISSNGKVYNLVPVFYRAWHAGLSKWNDEEDINSSSIGIEIDYYPTNLNRKYNSKLIKSLIKLLKFLINKYKIDTKNILGHSDIAPYRKIDPGKNFPWKKLAKFNVAYEPVTDLKKFYRSLDNWFFKIKIKTKKSKALLLLSIIGYDTKEASDNMNKFKMLIRSYQSRYSQKNINSRLDKITYKVIQNHVLNILLTKN